MEVLTIFYMWENKWLWGCPYPKQPSIIHFILGSLYTTTAFISRYSQLTNTNQTFKGYLPTESNKWQVMYILSLFISGILELALGWRQRIIEQKRLIDPKHKVDEIGLRINHYFKRKEAIMSTLGYSILALGVLKVFISIKFLMNNKNYEKSFIEIIEVGLGYLDLFSALNLIGLFIILASKFVFLIIS